MRMLVLRPPQILSYFNAGHHLALYQVTDYLRRAVPSATTDVLDATMGLVTWKDFSDLMLEGQFAFVFLQVDMDGVDNLDRTIAYIRELSPGTRIVAFGRLCGISPDFVARWDFDAMVVEGDFEAGCLEARELLIAEATTPGKGVRVRRSANGLLDPHGSGIFIDPDEWPLPGHSEIPYERYAVLYADDRRRFSGIPDLRELVVPVSRGCPIGCSFCEVPAAFGRKDRRVSVQRVVDYIDQSFSEHPFDYVSFYAPTFTLDRAWMSDLLDALDERVTRPWKCCTTVHHLDESLVARMAATGCFRISVGVETFDESSEDLLPRVKRKQRDKFTALAKWCRDNSVELNCFVMIGLPGGDSAAVAETMTFITSHGGRVRPTVYSPYDSLDVETPVDESLFVNRQLLQPSLQLSAADRRQAYDLASSVTRGSGVPEIDTLSRDR